MILQQGPEGCRAKTIANQQRIYAYICAPDSGNRVFAHGAQKLLGWFGGFGFTATVGAFGKMGMPPGLVYFVMFVEFFGGLSMTFGLLSRLAGLGIAAEMCGAIATVHFRNGFFMNWYGTQKGEGFEYHLLTIAVAVLIMVRGAGALSLDRQLTRKN